MKHLEGIFGTISMGFFGGAIYKVIEEGTYDSTAFLILGLACVLTTAAFKLRNDSKARDKYEKEN